MADSDSWSSDIETLYPFPTDVLSTFLYTYIRKVREREGEREREREGEREGEKEGEREEVGQYLHIMTSRVCKGIAETIPCCFQQMGSITEKVHILIFSKGVEGLVRNIRLFLPWLLAHLVKASVRLCTITGHRAQNNSQFPCIYLD